MTNVITAPGRLAIVFGVNIQHARDLADSFNARGIPAAAVWGQMNEDEFDEAMRDFQAGKIRVLCNARLVEQIKALPVRQRWKLLELIIELEEHSTTTPASLRRVQWPDVEARAKRVFGNKIMPNLVLMERGESPF